ncbi:UbiX family flavin prenyltransferase [Deferrisoma camini]|uniref:UbiX family flavin prenyltransferase n=1 Tax=Deferrisoma camini TaxID=1035120 RepID=UPI00046D213B|nr:UbiX family flavin prenyltransferase [Deferrisoma camini]
MSAPRRMVVGISGATGPQYGIRLLQVLGELGVETHLVLSKAARRNIRLESDWTPERVEALASKVYDPEDVGAAIASGSFLTEGMVVAPCSVKTASAISNSYNDNLLVRAADVTLKERRPLVLLFRETPLHKGHLDILRRCADIGAVILPPMVAFYHRPRTVEEIVDQTVGKVLDQLRIEHNLFRRWKGSDVKVLSAGG